MTESKNVSPFQKGKTSDGANRAEEGGAEKKDEKENQLKRTKSRELRGGVMYYSCHCIKRNGLQHDCRRTGCGGEPSCLTLPDPLCAPSQLARARGLADPAALAAHTHGSGGSGGPADSGSGGGKRFIVCELKGIVPDVSVDKSGKCCKCPTSLSVPIQKTVGGHVCVASDSFAPKPSSNAAGCSACPCAPTLGSKDNQAMFVFDEKTIQTILNSFETKELATKGTKTIGPGGRIRNETKPIVKEVCTRPGCVHWQPPPPCVWDLPCKADCFETPAGIQPGRNPLTRGGGGGCVKESRGQSEVRGAMPGGSHQPHQRMKLLTPECCTGCSASNSGGAAAASGGPAAGLPVLVMKLC